MSGNVAGNVWSNKIVVDNYLNIFPWNDWVNPSSIHAIDYLQVQLENTNYQLQVNTCLAMSRSY